MNRIFSHTYTHKQCVQIVQHMACECFCPYRRFIKKVEMVSDSSIHYISQQWSLFKREFLDKYLVVISLLPLKQETLMGASELHDDTFISDMFLAECLWSVAHEARHLQQQIQIFTKERLSNDELAMIRMNALGATFSGYYNAVYSYDLTEIDADIFGIAGAIDYANQYLDIDINQALVDRVNVNVDRYNLGYIDSVDDLLDHLESRKTLYLTESRLKPVQFGNTYSLFDPNNLKDQHLKSWMKTNCPEWLELDYAKDSCGVAFDEKLFAALLDCDRSWINQYDGLDAEVLRIQSTYPSKIITGVSPGTCFSPHVKKPIRPVVVAPSPAEAELFRIAGDIRGRSELDGLEF